MIARRPLRLSILTAFSAIVIASAPGACLTGNIDNFPSTAFLGSLGEPFAPYFAQTFKALPGAATNLAIELAGDSGPGDTEFRVLITEVSGSGPNFHPTTVLFESPTISFSSGASPTVVRIPLSALELIPGRTYTVILDAFVTRDGLDGRARVATNGTYADGAFYFNQGFAGNSRTEHFADTWFVAESIYPPDYHDIAFQLTFAPAATPGTLISPDGTDIGATPIYTWNAVPGATWYELWVNDSGQARKIDTWYTAAGVGCAGGTGTCFVSPSVPLAPGNAIWWIQWWG